MDEIRILAEMDINAALMLLAQPSSIDGMIRAWLDAKHNRGFAGPDTAQRYAKDMASFRAMLGASGFDLDAPKGVIALFAQVWAGRNNPSPSTRYGRLCPISSFYDFCVKRDFLPSNPIDLVERRRPTEYRGVRPLEYRDVQLGLAAIDRTTLRGARDYALLATALQTGRRLNEVKMMTWGDMEKLADGRLLISFPRCKFGKQMSDILPPALTEAIFAWLKMGYAPNELGSLEASAPIWLSLAHNWKWYPLSRRAMEKICLYRLGTSRFHRLRHTFAHAMEDAGAKLSEIQSRLGHSSIATTGLYLAALRSAENPVADKLITLFGIRL